MPLKKEEIIARACDAAFGQPLVTNVLRAILVEAMIALVLSKSWKWCSSDYQAYDFIHEDRTRLEVKQSASRQTWSGTASPPSKAIWDIAPRTGYYVGEHWTAQPGRNADIYVFAHHPVCDATADHRDPSQWRFYVVQTAQLPPAKTISLARLNPLASAVDIHGLPDQVERSRALFRTPGGQPS